MADIAMVFHWPPNIMDEMTLEELVMWWGKARDRAEAQNGGSGGPQP
ncbi:GpE family phage tail protein [Leisingera sp. MMG026]|nr:GpE family phage tail protein [Leisingera sp. MMG026]MCF6432597.1 GpE family phage tail protein [Leisingera sp. MMG026]